MGTVEKLELEDVDRLNTQEYTPAIVVMTFIVIIGLTGNTFAAIFFIWKSQKSVINFFISCVCVNDAITNAVLVQEIVQLFFYLSCDNTISCKLFVLLKHWVVGNSLLFMVAMAVERYRRVCFPFSKQITYPIARYIISGLTVFSFLIASRNIATVEIFRFNITAGSNSTVTGYYCTQSKKAELAKIKTIFHVVDIGIHGIVMCSFVVLNVLLLRKITQTKRKLISHEPSVSFKFSRVNIETSIEGPSTDVVTIDSDHKSGADPVAKNTPKVVRDSLSTAKDAKALGSKFKPSTTRRKSVTLRRTLSHLQASWTEVKITMMVVVITIISALCFVPYYVAMLTVKQDFSGSATIMTTAEILARRSYILNSAVNPYIMLVFNLPFRHFIVSVVCCLCLRCRKTK